MPNRTVKLYGKVYGDSAVPATLTVNWDGQTVYSGAVVTSSDPVDPRVEWANMDELVTWTMDTAVSGPRAMTLTIENGTMVFHTLHANYLGNSTGPAFDNDGNLNPGFTLNSDGFPIFIGSDQDNVVTPTEDAFKDLTGTATEASDGFDETSIDGVAVSRNTTTEQEAIGKWNWIFYPGSTFTCQANVQPAILE